MDLYTDYAEDFSNTRKKSWEGWNELTSKFVEISEPNILDLGCGNGRFLDYLLDNKIKFKSYTGIDYSEKLLQIATSKFENIEKARFDQENLLEKWKLPDSKSNEFEIIVSFGFTHHLETPESRKYFFEMVKSLLSLNGIFVVTFWNFKDNKNLFNKAKFISENLFSLPFGKNANRVCYYYPESEKLEYFKQNNLQVINHFFADSKSGKGNEYFVLRHA